MMHKSGVLAARGIKKRWKCLNKEIMLSFSMDKEMPTKKGIEATEEKRYYDSNNNKQACIDALTAGMTTEDEEKCRQRGRNEFVSKHFNIKYITNVFWRMQ